ncbi:MAG: calcium sensor EFh, partial [Pseudomonadota bacterium]
MRKLLISTGLVLVGCGIALAQAGKGPERMFERIDTDADGRITAAESRAFREARFQRLDVDEDGAVTLDEMKAMKRQRASQDRMSRRFARADTNGNGAIERT